MFHKGAPRTERIALRLTAVERGYLVEAAGTQGVSEFIRSIIRKHIEPKKKGRLACARISATAM